MDDLTVEQRFSIAKTKLLVENVDKEDLEELFIDMYTLMLRKDNLTKKLLNCEYGGD